MPLHRVPCHWTQLILWAVMNLQSWVRTLGPAYMQASWELPRAMWLAPLCTLQLASLSSAAPDQEPYWTSSVYTRPVKQVMLLFCHFSFQTLLKCQDIRKQVRDRVFSLQSLRPTKACRGHRLHWRPLAVSLKWCSYAFKDWKGGVDKSKVKVKSTVFLSLLLAAFQRKENARLEAGSLSCGSINNNFHLHRKIP